MTDGSTGKNGQTKTIADRAFPIIPPQHRRHGAGHHACWPSSMYGRKALLSSEAWAGSEGWIRNKQKLRHHRLMGRPL